MENRLIIGLLELVFTAVYFAVLFRAVKWLFRLAPVNFVFDLLAIVCIVLALVASVGLAEVTVRKIREYL